MLAKTKRLNLSRDFKWVKAGKVLYSPHFQIFIRPGENKIAKVGVAVSSKIFPNAVLRNQAKRRVFGIFEKLYPVLPGNINIIALPKAGMDKVELVDLSLEIKEALGKVEIKL